MRPERVLLFLSFVGCAPKGAASPREEEPPATRPMQVPDGEPASSGPTARSESQPQPQPDEVGLASWYGNAFAGRRTSSGEKFDPTLFTAAHKKLPFGTWVEVRRIDTGRTVRVRINDRGPNGRAQNRIIDLSRHAAEALDILRTGVVRVELRVVSGP